MGIWETLELAQSSRKEEEQELLELPGDGWGRWLSWWSTLCPLIDLRRQPVGLIPTRQESGGFLYREPPVQKKKKGLQILTLRAPTEKASLIICHWSPLDNNTYSVSEPLLLNFNRPRTIRLYPESLSNMRLKPKQREKVREGVTQWRQQKENFK